MKRIAIWTLSIIGGMTVLGVVLVVIFALSTGGPEPVPDRVILEVDLEEPILEHAPDDPLSKLRGRRLLVMEDLVAALDHARQDDRVVGLLGRIGSTQIGFAQIQEVRDAVRAFARSGKPTVAWAETFGELGPGMGGYYLATAFEEVHLQPSGDVGLAGIRMESPFLKGFFEKIGVLPVMDHRKEYKSMKNTLTEDAFTEAHREMTEALARSVYDQVVDGIATGRALAREEAEAAVGGGPHFAEEAKASGLVDGLAYRDEVRDSLKARVADDVQFLDLAAYAQRTRDDRSRGTPVALIFGTGMVARGESQGDPMFGEVMGSETVTRAFRTAVDDAAVQAILFRVDSPGGSYVASDAIWHETVRAREAGKPVIVSMGNVAGSGGYFVSMSADRIVAHPGTLTGSIGVVAGKLVTRDMWNELGITWGEVSLGENAGLYSSLKGYDASEKERFEAWLDRVYDDFTGKVARGRNLTPEAVEAAARGRVWTGAQALEHGLVDTLGGYPVALSAVREALSLEDDAPIRLKRFPAPKSLVESLIASLSEGAATFQAAGRVLQVAEPAVRAMESLGMGEAGVLRMIPVAPGM